MAVKFYAALLRSGRHKSVYIPGLKQEIPVSNPLTVDANVGEKIPDIRPILHLLREPIIGVIKKTKDYLADEMRPLDDFIKVVEITLEV